MSGRCGSTIFDTDCEGVIDLLGYDTGGDGKIERYRQPPQSLRITDLAKELVIALHDGTIPYSQIEPCS